MLNILNKQPVNSDLYVTFNYDTNNAIDRNHNTLRVNFRNDKLRFHLDDAKGFSEYFIFYKVMYQDI